MLTGHSRRHLLACTCHGTLILVRNDHACRALPLSTPAMALRQCMGGKPDIEPVLKIEER
jgi:hypothetical protein